MKLGARSTTSLTLFALVTGSLLGLLIHGSLSPSVIRIGETASALGTLYTNAIRIVVIPLIVSMLVSTVSARGSSRDVGRVFGLSLATFGCLLLTGVLFVLLVAPPLLHRLPAGLRPSSTASREGTRSPAQTDGKETTDASISTSPAAKLGRLLPSNLIKAAENEELLALVVFAILLGLAATRLAEEQRHVLISFFGAVAETLRILAGWILRALPIGVFCVSLSATMRMGWGTLGVVGYWIAMVCILIVTFTILLYLIAGLIGGVRISDFARALAEAQWVAIATRSSAAALPALLRGAAQHLPGYRAVAEMTLPFSIASFKLNRAVSSTYRLLFLAQIYDMELSPTVVATFIATALLTSFATAGLPSSGAAETLPLYVAAGIPVEGVILLGSVDMIPDFFMTVLNVTGDMTSMTIVARASGLEVLPVSH